MTRLTKTFATVLVTAGLAAGAFAANSAKQEIATAIQHAEFSSQAKQVAEVHLHLHHVVNCLVGEHGKQFYAPAGDPCKGMGNGAINDAGEQTPLEAKLKRVLAEAEHGLSESDVKAAHTTALHVKRMLKRALAMAR